jgi:serine/threonine protein kinase
MATPTTREEILELLRKSGVLKPDVLQKYLDEHPELPADPKAVAALLVQSKLLTQFQAKLLLAGRYRGFRLGSYVLLEQLGQGGMGAVYLAEHETLQRKAAIKVLPPGGNKLTVERFLREARAAAALDHPNIVRMHDVGREGEVHFLVMEYVEGQTLDKLVTSTAPLQAQRAVEYIAQACAGLQHAYERGFIHRDIKPANLILSKDGTVKILDMGLARSNEQHDQLTQLLDAGAIVGTADYISPEQAINDPNVDIRTDIYSLGATFFAIVTGRPPFDGPTASKLVQHQVKEPPSVTNLDRTFPKGLSSVIAKMMAKKPSDRYSTPAEVIDALQPWQNESAKLLAGLSQTMAGQTGSLNRLTGRIDPAEKPKKTGRGKLLAVVGGLAAALVLGIGITAALVLGGGTSQSKAGGTPPAPATAAPTSEASKPAPPPSKAKPTPVATKPAVVRPPDPPAPGKSLFAFDSAKVPEFTVVKSKQTTVGGQDGKFPPGIYVHSYKPDSQAEFRREIHAGKPAIAMYSISGVPSAQIVFDLEDKIKVPLAPDRRYVATVEYAMAGQGNAVMTVAGPSPKFTKIGSANLTPTEGKYQTKSVPFVRVPGMPARLAIDVQSGGVENTLYVHRVELSEDPTPAPRPMPNRVVYKLDLSDPRPVVVTMLTQQGATADSKTHKEVKRVPLGTPFPAGWYGRSSVVNSTCETEVGPVDGAWALGIRTPKAEENKIGSAILFSPRLECPSGAARLRFEYQAPIAPGKSMVRAKVDGKQAETIARLTTPTNGWVLHEQTLDLKGSANVFIEIANTGEPGETLWVRNFSVTELEPSALGK